jgi:hypothetical protein
LESSGKQQSFQVILQKSPESMNANTVQSGSFVNSKQKSMKRNILVFGLISGLVVALWMAITISVCYDNPNFEANMWMGYASMVAAFSLIFVAIKNYRDKYNGGTITFGKAFQIGMYITLIASTMYVITWLIMYYFFMPDFMEKFVAAAIRRAETGGESAAQIAATREQMAGYTEMYKSPVMVVLFTYMEVLPVGLLISLIAAAILKRKGRVAIA